MKHNLKEIKDLANLAKLDLTESDIQNITLDFEKMLNFIHQLNNINTDGVKPLIHVHDKTNILREDVVVQKDIKTSILERSSNHNTDYFKVPKVVKNK